jgi:lysophospholipase L1-like esterase
LPRNVVYNIHNTAPRGLAGLLDESLVHTKNSLGFRGPEPPANFDDALTIIAVGGSTTECFFLSDTDAWPAQLGNGLAQHFKELWLNNAGLDGHSTFGHLQLMREYITGLHPKFVTILAGINDMFADTPNGYDKAPIQSALSSLARYSEVAALAMAVWRHEQTVEIRDLGAMPRPINLHDAVYHTLEHSEATDPPRSEGPDEQARLNGYRRRLEELIELARANRIEPILITQPALFGAGVDDATGVDLGTVTTQFDSTLSGSRAWAALERFNDAMRDVGREKSAAVIDLAHLMPKSSRFYYDFLHFSKTGAAKVAEIVAAQMCPILAEKAPGYLSTACVTP